MATPSRRSPAGYGADCQVITISAQAVHGGIKEFCEQEFDNLEKFPAEELRGLLQFLENRVRHMDNLVIALLAAMVGGLVGGALAMLAA
jgi:hypothetical protein